MNSGLDADELQRDVGHRGQDAGDRDREPEPAAAEPALHEVGRRDVAVAVRDRPQPWHEHEDDRIDDDRVRHREEAADRAGREHRRGHGHERVGGVEVAAEQEPGDEGAEAAAAKAPLVEAGEAGRPPPPGRGEADDGDEDEEDQDDRQRCVVDAGHRSPLPPRARVTIAYAIEVHSDARKTQRNWYQ
jgi:hypothetical protein